MPSSACDLMGILLEWITLCGVVNRDIHDPPTDNECSIPTTDTAISMHPRINTTDLKTLLVDKVMHNTVLLRDDVMRDKERWQTESCQVFFSLRCDWWQNSAEAGTLHRAPSLLNFCRNHFMLSLHFLLHRNDSLTQRYSCNLCKHNRETFHKDLLVYFLHRQLPL